MGCARVAHEGHRTAPGDAGGGTVMERPFEPALRPRQELARAWRPRLDREMTHDLVAGGVLAPVPAGGAVRRDRDDVDQRAAAHRIVHQMR